ncbi:sugar/nucleoside kinase (ribokinase family) [Cryobacterium sp. MP_M5]|uniref:PfkB family carbohydrate kinase n=1 Tax=unclassified Cryobacterium TaxID=2649013 RepID=UPI0018CADEC8|nr:MULTISPECIES: PfkB family carbohydrate kinase [unclassified Cryobacterium]MBG6056949.1 sugar/nucleoside kinase (ribokinase family) [Cryobacterium sp. MP_M3]MEC5175148.1 sugar/nucleoside kinase (ribokinase family) [Cryobacterium sp. MP_M5]
MAEPPRLVFTGNVIVDVVLTIDRLPEAGSDTLASSSRLTAGGGFNTMAAARRDGLAVTFLGRYGQGPFGDIVHAALGADGIEAAQPALPGLDSGYCVVLVDDSAERTFVTWVGAEGRLDRGDLDLAEVRPGDLVYVSGYSLAHPANAAAIPGWLRELPPAARVITDPSPLIATLDPATLAEVMARTDVFSANAREARHLTGTGEPGDAAARLVGSIRPGGFVVVRDGRNGCWLAGDTLGLLPVHVRGFTVHVVDTTGAGDTHCGVLAAALARGLTPREAARRANAAAALAVTRPGPATAPAAAAIDAFLRDAGAPAAEHPDA